MKHVSSDQQFSQDKFLEWARQHAPEINPLLPVSIQQFQGGQSNPTYLLKQKNLSLVLRRKPSGNLLPSAHAIDREYKVIQSLFQNDFKKKSMKSFTTLYNYITCKSIRIDDYLLQSFKRAYTRRQRRRKLVIF